MFPVENRKFKENRETRARWKASEEGEGEGEKNREKDRGRARAKRKPGGEDQRCSRGLYYAKHVFSGGFMVGHFATDFHRVPAHRACSLPSLFFPPFPGPLANFSRKNYKTIQRRGSPSRNSQFGEINWNANATDAYGWYALGERETSQNRRLVNFVGEAAFANSEEYPRAESVIVGANECRWSRERIRGRRVSSLFEERRDQRDIESRHRFGKWVERGRASGNTLPLDRVIYVTRRWTPRGARYCFWNDRSTEITK